MAEPTKTQAAGGLSSSARSGVVIDPRVLLAGGAVAFIGLVVLGFFLWMVPNAAKREQKAACTGLRATGPMLCKTALAFGGAKGGEEAVVRADGEIGDKPCPLPMQAPDFTAVDNNGRPVSLSQFRGKVVLLNFWASWCGVCKSEKPKLAQMAEDLASDDFVVVALASDRSWQDVLLATVGSLSPRTKVPDGDVSMEQALGVYKQALPSGVPFKVFLDPPKGDGNIGAIAESWGIKAVPESALIDRNGVIRAYFVNKRDWESPVAETCLRSVIDE
jgi:thiol-disulfide isomerase/thioredoxin